jgi:hypothetical protein
MHHRKTYAYTSTQRVNGKRQTISLQQLIMGPGRWSPPNGNALDCRRANLMPATPCDSSHAQGRHINNISGFKGVCRRLDNGMYRAAIGVNGRVMRLGQHATAEAAACAWDAAARLYHLEFSMLSLAG